MCTAALLKPQEILEVKRETRALEALLLEGCSQLAALSSQWLRLVQKAGPGELVCGVWDGGVCEDPAISSLQSAKAGVSQPPHVSCSDCRAKSCCSVDWALLQCLAIKQSNLLPGE